MKYDESDNIFIRASRTLTDKVGDIFRVYLKFDKFGNIMVFDSKYIVTFSRGCVFTVRHGKDTG